MVLVATMVMESLLRNLPRAHRCAGRRRALGQIYEPHPRTVRRNIGVYAGFSRRAYHMGGAPERNVAETVDRQI